MNSTGSAGPSSQTQESSELIRETRSKPGLVEWIALKSKLYYFAQHGYMGLTLLVTSTIEVLRSIAWYLECLGRHSCQLISPYQVWRTSMHSGYSVPNVERHFCPPFSSNECVNVVVSFFYSCHNLIRRLDIGVTITIVTVHNYPESIRWLASNWEDL